MGTNSLNFWRVLPTLLVLVGALLGGCQKRENQNDWPVNHWLNDSDECVRATAVAIVKSGRPWPNEVYDRAGKLTRFDLWVGSQLYELPGDFPLDKYGSGLPKHHPLRYNLVFGNAEHYLNIPSKERLSTGESKVPSSLYGRVECGSARPKEYWVESSWVSAATRDQAIAMTLARVRDADHKIIIKTEIKERIDLGMTEVRSYTNPPELARASYFPISKSVEQEINGKHVVKGIICYPYDPDAKVDPTRLCESWIYLGPGLWMEFGVYQQMLPIVPELHNKLLKALENSRKI
jgi:hypothetical protein